jgi:hypothetical protein
VPQPELAHLQILAGLSPNRRILNVMIVNVTNEARRVTVCVPGAGRKKLFEYRYFDTDHPTDADGFAVPKESNSEADLKAGVPVAMPSSGVVFLSVPQ